MRALLIAAIGMAVALLALTAGLTAAHEGHDHDPSASAIPQNVLLRGEVASADFELVAIANGTELLIFLDRFNTNAPVEDAVIEVETPDGSATATAEFGVYRLPALWLAKKEKVDLIFTVKAGGLTDILPLALNAQGNDTRSVVRLVGDRINALFQPSLLIAGFAGALLGIGLMTVWRRRQRAVAILIFVFVPMLCSTEVRAQSNTDRAGATAIGSALRERAQRLPDGTIFVPKTVQRIFEIRTALSEVASHRRVMELPGRVIPDLNASGFVQAAVGGRLSPPEAGFPRLGALVKRGDVLAYVTPPLQAIDVSDMRQRQGELDQQIQIVGQRLARYETLAPSGAVALSQLEDTRLELQGLKDRRAALDTARRNTEALLAPVSGVIAEGTPISGQMAQPNAVIFHIVDPAKLWIEALSFEPLAGAETASAVTVAGKRLSLTYRGAGFADRNQSVSVHFAIDSDVSDLRGGQLVTVLVNTRDAKRGIAVPRTSIVRSTNGQDFIYVHISAERFQPRGVRIEPLDGGRVLILSGIEAGQRVVTQGAELLDHVR